MQTFLINWSDKSASIAVIVENLKNFKHIYIVTKQTYYQDVIVECV